MPIIVNTNIASMSAQRHLGSNTNALNKSLEKLSSGFRINRASDDAAGLQISENLRAQIRGSKKALDNVQDGINMLNIVDGAFQSVGDNFQRIRELAVMGANDTYDVTARDALEKEMVQLYEDIVRISETTSFNGVDLLNSNTPATYIIQVGANTTVNDEIDIAGMLGDDPPVDLLLNTFIPPFDFLTHADADFIIDSIDYASGRLLARRAQLGAIVNRLESAAQNLQISIENQSAAESRIRDADIALETASMTRNQILQQSSAAILQQANQVPSLALQLLQGGQ